MSDNQNLDMMEDIETSGVTINKVIERVDRVKPNVYDEQTKAEWLYRLDGRISREILKEDPPQRYVYAEDGDKELLVPHPYDDLYDYYMMAMIDYSNQEYGSYNNALLMYNEAFWAYAKLYQRENLPKSAGRFNNLL